MPVPKKVSPNDAMRLATVRDPAQRAALQAALERGEVIPEFAWRDLPVPMSEPDPELDRGVADAFEQIRPLAEARGMSVTEYLEWVNRAGETQH